MSLVWSRTESASGPSISIVLSDGTPVNVGKEHVNQAAITLLLAQGAPEAEILELLRPAEAIAKRFKRLSERVTTDGSDLFLDGDAMDDALTAHILKLIRLENQGESADAWEPFVRFLEKLVQNPSRESQESLFDFVRNFGLTVRPNGDFIAYKGVNDDFGSVRRGPGIVDGVEQNGHLANKPGSILEVKRSYVDANRLEGCSTGLHAGTHRYASGWGSTVVAVAINPRDVVSVPKDGAFEKLRVARYEVLLKVDRETAKADATVGDASKPVWRAAAPAAPKAIDPKLLKKLKKAQKKGLLVSVKYAPRGRAAKKYQVNVNSISATHAEVSFLEDAGRRTFVLSRVEGVKFLDA